jgi:CheY-like chemotaxis protein
MDFARNHILVVDDLADTADSTVELLSLWGYDAIASYSGAAALDSACRHRPDAVLLDLGMPCMDGFQFTRLFRELPGCGSIPIIAVTGHYRQAYRSRASEAGISEYLLKPADPKCLEDLLARTIVTTIVPPSLGIDAANRLTKRTLSPKRQSFRGMPGKEYTTWVRELACL